MEKIIVAKNKQTQQIETFSELDWYNIQKTGLYEYITTTSNPEQFLTASPQKAITPKSSGCSKCGRKK